MNSELNDGDGDHACRYNELVKSTNGPRVFFAAEVACYPRQELAELYPSEKSTSQGRSPFKYLNAGLMVGPAGLVRRLIALAYQGDCSDDQLMYTLAYLDPIVWWEEKSGGEKHFRVASMKQNAAESIPPTAKPLIGLDHWNSILMAMFRTQSTDYKVCGDKRCVQYVPTMGFPLVLHQNGAKKGVCMLDLLSREFGYEYNVTDKSQCSDAVSEVVVDAGVQI